MTNDSNSGPSPGCISVFIGIPLIIASFSLDPIDLCRSIYNGLIGDTPILKKELLDYVRKNYRKNEEYTPKQRESNIANLLNYNLNEGERIDPQQVSVERLWDAAEDYSESFYQRWFWTSLNH